MVIKHNLVYHIKRGMQNGCVSEQGAEENIWTNVKREEVTGVTEY
jgi:hypothetical protein